MTGAPQASKQDSMLTPSNLVLPISVAPDGQPVAASSSFRAAAIGLVGLTIFAWIAVLAMLVLRTANPATINPLQVRSADAAVVVTLSPTGTGNFLVEEILFARDTIGIGPGETISVRDLPANVNWSVAKRWILPLVKRDGLWEVSSGLLAWNRNGPAENNDFLVADVHAFVYPDIPGVREALQAAIGN